MGTTSLGIDISDSAVTGVVLIRQGNNLVLEACLSLPLAQEKGIVEQVRHLCSQLAWGNGTCVCGLPLSLFSVRTLFLPFRDSKKIVQTLPFELEEQMLVPTETMAVDFSVAKKTDAGSLINAFALEQSFIEDLVIGLEGEADPDIVTPAMVPLAAHLARQDISGGDFLLVHADLHSSSLTLVLNNRPVFFRRICAPEELIVHPPFVVTGGQLVVTDEVAAQQAADLFSGLIQRSLDFFCTEWREESRPQRILLTGPLAEMAFIAERLHAVCGLPVDATNLLPLNRIGCSQEQRALWRATRFDRALSLALQGLEKKAPMNFRAGLFAKKRALFSSRKQMVAAATAVTLAILGAIGWLWFDYSSLRQRDRALDYEMTAIFTATFPGVTKVRDPYIEMQARLKSMQGPESPVPLFFHEKRVLDLLADISVRIPESVVFQVTRLSIDREAVLIKGTTDTFNAVEAIKNSLSASTRYKTVQIVSASADKGKKNGQIRFELQLQLETL